MPKEKDFQLKVEKFLTDKGIYFVKYWGGGIYTRSGIPDLICCLRGLFLALELKTDDGIVSPLQEYNLEKISNSGGATIVLRPKYFEQFKEAIQKFIEEEYVDNTNNKITLKSYKEFQIFEEITSLIEGDIDIKHLDDCTNEITLKIVYDIYHYKDFLEHTK